MSKQVGLFDHEVVGEGVREVSLAAQHKGNLTAVVCDPGTSDKS